MENKLLRVGTDKSQLNARDASILPFGARHEFVYLRDFWPWHYVNGTWTGAPGHLLHDNRMDWKHCVRVK